MRFCIVFSNASDVSVEDISEEDISVEDISKDDISEKDISEENITEKNLSGVIFAYVSDTKWNFELKFSKKKKIIIISKRNTYQSHDKWQG